MKKIDVKDAVGTVLAHDITRIIPGQFKGVAFKKGHVVRQEDVQELYKLGKRSLFTLELGTNEIHEDDAALRIAKAVSDNSLRFTDPSEGKSSIISKSNGLLKVNQKALLKINKLEHIVIATLKDNYPCTKDLTIAATRIIPLTIPATRIDKMEEIAKKYGPVLSVKPYRKLKVGAVVTGSEIYNGLITDDFGPSIGKKLTDAGCKIEKKFVVSDDIEAISRSIKKLKELGCELIITTGGLSVDPDDVTRLGVINAGAKISFYGSPVLPGAMFMYALIDGIPIMGLPACVFHAKQTVFDLLLPRVLAGEELVEDDIAQMGHGGLCMNCEVCHFPVCSFGR